MLKKVALVTGSSKGIGKAIAVAFAKSNDYLGIVINSRNIEEAQKASEEIEASFDCRSIPIEADISKERDYQIDRRDSEIFRQNRCPSKQCRNSEGTRFYKDWY